MEEMAEKILVEHVKKLEERVTFLERFIGSKTASAPQHATPLQATYKYPVSAGTHTEQKTSNEIEIGQKWVSAVGIVLVFLAALFFVQFVFRFMGPLGKVGLSYVVAALLFIAGIFTKKKYASYSGVLTGGAWGVTYLVTYAMYFFPATRLITSSALEMVLLTGLVAVLLVIALKQKTQSLVSIGLVLGFLTFIMSPLALFSIIGCVLFLTALTIIAIYLPWGDLMLAATLGSYVTYFFWFSNILGRQGGGFLEKQMVGLGALVAMWIIIAIGIMMRKDKETSIDGNADSVSLILASAGTTFLGLWTLQDAGALLATPRTSQAIWLLILAVLHGGWSIMVKAQRDKKEITVSGSVITVLLGMSSFAYFLPLQSHALAFVWSVFGLSIVAINMFFPKKSVIGAVAAIPLIASALRFLMVDLQTTALSPVDGISLPLLLGLVITLITICSAALLYMRDITASENKHIKRTPGIILTAAFVVLYITAAQELTGALPSVVWSLAGLTAIAAGFFLHWKDARILGLAALAISVLRVFIYDLSNLEALPRVISFAILGGLLLLVGYGYNKNKDKLQKLLEE